MRVIPFIFLILVSVTSAFSAGTGSISGVVVDNTSKVPLKGALVAIKGTNIYATTDDSGYYLINDVESGRFLIDASLIGYTKQTLTDNVVKAGRRTTSNIGLTAAIIEGEVRIEAEHTDYFTTKSDIVVSDHSMSHEELKRQPGAPGGVQKVLSSLPGVALKGSKAMDLVVRGGAPDENLVILDDIEILSAAHFSGEDGAGGKISVLNLEVIENVEFIAGGFPAEYGGKSSSVMQLDLMEGARDSLSGSVYLDIIGSGAIIEGPIGSGNKAPGSYIATARFSTLELLAKVKDFEMGETVPDYWDTNFKLAYNLSPKHKLSLIGFYATDKMNTVSEDKEDDRWDVNSRTKMDAAGITHEWVHSGRGTLRTTVSRSANYWDYDSQLGGIGNDTDQEEYSFKSRLAYAINKRLMLIAGVHTRYYLGNYDYYRVAQYDDYGEPVSEIHEIGDLDTYGGDVYTEGIIRPAEWLTVTIGGRADYLKYNGDINLSPRLGVRLQLTPKTACNFATGRYFQTPFIYDLIRSNEATPDSIIKAGYADHYITGITYLLAPDIEIGVEGYYKILKNQPVTGLHNGEYVVANSGDGTVKGADFYIHKKLSGSFFARSAYSYVVTEMRDRPGDEYRLSDYDQTNVFNIILGYEPWTDWIFSSKYSYQTGLPYTPIVGRFHDPDTGTYYAVKGGINGERLPDYHQLDVHVDRAFNFSSWSITTYLDMLNVLNQNSVTGYSWNYDYSERITKTTIGIMPVLGIEAAF